ncbi:hypothetical protein P4U65_14745 [Bacillus pacificus]|nr:hypothetical protein [Bacillus pacificus]
MCNNPLEKPTITIKPKSNGPTKKNPEPCKHEFNYQESIRTSSPDGAWNTHWKKINIYYCIHCLEQKHTKDEEWSREKPVWY